MPKEAASSGTCRETTLADTLECSSRLRSFDAGAYLAMLTGGGAKSFGVVLAISAPGPVLSDLTADERQSTSS
jgi:hypothetical protein